MERNSMNRLEGKVAIITGGAGGIGSASAERFISEGARVVVADLFEDRAREVAERLGPNALPMFYDAGDDDSIEAAVKKTVERFGRLDILFNNAAVTDVRIQAQDTTPTDIPLDVWDKTMAVNVRGVMIGCRFAVPHMIAGGGGSIINTASDSGKAGDNVRLAYGTSKGAVITMTQYIAVQYGRQGIRCNAICPGVILTAQMKKLPVLAETIFRHVVTPRLGEPEDIAALAAFLAADESAYITAQAISCDGGHLAHQPQLADMIDLERSGKGDHV
jgi:NAD(P)-dependent dehydrogenase (short-subunit alcohol dehydrogenase family)